MPVWFISIHSLRMEGDIRENSSPGGGLVFQSTPSAWRETFGDFHHVPHSGHFNPLPPHGGRPVKIAQLYLLLYFNPLPPHGGRPSLRSMIIPSFHFNPLPPHGGRLITCANDFSVLIFQSTPSAWRETRFVCRTIDSRMYFNPLPPHGGRLDAGDTRFAHYGISIHSLRMEGDAVRILIQKCQPYFNPLPPHGGRLPTSCISSSHLHFNPLPPHGGRLRFRCNLQVDVVFQSTPSAWRETPNVVINAICAAFQSTPSAWRETPTFRSPVHTGD